MACGIEQSEIRKPPITYGSFDALEPGFTIRRLRGDNRLEDGNENLLETGRGG